MENASSEALLVEDSTPVLHPGQEPFEAKDEVVEEERFGEKPEQEVKEKPPATEKKIEVEGEDNSLLKQIEALKKSEELHKRNSEQYQRERDEARTTAQARETEASQTRHESYQHQLDSVSTAMGAAQSAADAAKRDIKNAIANGDSDAQIEAMDRLASARADIARLEDGKMELEARVKEPPKRADPPQSDPIDQLNIPVSAKSWLKEHPEYVTNPRKNAQIQYLHHEVLDEGHQFGSAEYFESIETKLGMRRAPEPEDDEDDAPPPPKKQPQRNHIVSAPVSRDTPSASGRRQENSETLTRDEQEAARIAGVSNAEYAKQKKRIREMKANGSYGGQQ